MERETKHEPYNRNGRDHRRLRALAGHRLASWLPRIVSVLRAVGPYALMEILLPGGTLIAISVWLYRRYAARKSTARVSLAAALTSFAFARTPRPSAGLIAT